MSRTVSLRKNPLVVAISTGLLLSSLLVGCGGGGGGGTPETAANQAVLGPLSGSTINAFRLTDLATVIEGPITAEESADLASAGQFELELEGIADSEWILVAASGGEDIDANDDGTIDPTATLNNGTVFAVAKAATWKASEGNITALSDMAWRFAQDQASDSIALETRLEALADWLIATDIDGDSNIDYDDLMRFDPQQHATQAAIDYSALLPSGDFASPSYIDRLHNGDSDTGLETALQDDYSATPWTPDTTPDAFSFTAENNLGLSQFTESNEVTISGINRKTAISIANGEYSLNGGSYTSDAGALNNGDTVQVSLTSSSSNGTAVTGTLTIGGVDGTFVGTTYTLGDTPDAFAFNDQTNVTINTEVESNAITLSGINGSGIASIHISGGQYSINSGSYTATAATISNSDTVKVKLTSSPSYSAGVVPGGDGGSTSVTLTIGGVSDSFDVTNATYTTHSFLDAGGDLGTLGMPMVYINAQGQSFTQGCHDSGLAESGVNDDSNCRSDEKPERLITFAHSFAMSAHEITWDAWDACVSDGDCTAVSVTCGSYLNGVCVPLRDDDDTRPAVVISYDDITTDFIPWLNSKTGQIFRLPTESEWEYAARSGSTTVYSWGDDIGTNNANCLSTSCGDISDLSSPAGSFAPNAYGLYDMHGNVYEFTADVYNSDYNGAPIDGSARTSGSGSTNSGSGGIERSLRGGSYGNFPQGLRSAIRGGYTDSAINVGFRLVQDI